MSEGLMPHEFEVYKLNGVGMKKARQIADAFSALLHHLGKVCTDGREFSICKTKLEEACFFAKKAMAINMENQVVGEGGNTPGDNPPTRPPDWESNKEDVT